MKRILISFLVTLVLPACISATKAPPQTSLEKIEKLSIGASQAQVLTLLGTPSTKELQETVELWTYTIPYKKWMLPEMKLTFSKSGILVEKFINLFGTDGNRLYAPTFKKRYSKNSFVDTVEKYATSNHSYSERGHLKDEKAGIYAEYNTSRKDEIQTIRWTTPDARKAASN